MARYIALLLFVPGLFAQSSDAVITQILGEIRALRQDLETINITSQRVQITLYRLQSQTAIVNSAQQRFDSAHAALIETQSRLTRLAVQVQTFERETRGTIDSLEKANMQKELPQAKAMLETLTAEEATRRSTESDAAAQLRTEQARLADLQALLERLDKALDELARKR